MNREDVIAMAREAGLPHLHPGEACIAELHELEHLVRAAYAAGAAAEREACAYRAGIALLGADRGLANRVDQAIRARGQA